VPGSHGDQAGARGTWLRWRQIVVIAVCVAVLVVIILVSRHTLAESLTALANLDWRWFLLALAFEAVSLTAFGLSRQRLLRAEGHTATFTGVMAVTYAGNALSMSLPFAGTQLAVVFTYRQFRRHGVGSAVTSWALAVSAIMSTTALALILVVGTFAGGASFATAAGFAVAALFMVPAVAVLLALRFRRVRRALHQVLARLIRFSQRLFRRPRIDVEGMEDFLDRVASIKLTWLRYGEVFGLAVVNWLADCGCLACAILATGQRVPWHGLVLAYGAGAAAGSTGVTPGGFAIVELALTAALTAAGLGAGHALTAVLVYRLLNFWAILVGGWIAVFILTHRHRPGEPVEGREGEHATPGRGLAGQTAAARPPGAGHASDGPPAGDGTQAGPRASEQETKSIKRF
jgi:putative heme transporter